MTAGGRVGTAPSGLSGLSGPFWLSWVPGGLVPVVTGCDEVRA